ncbi:MAG: archaetidylserine decarboxylase [Gammaproteobacteria bacterium]
MNSSATVSPWQPEALGDFLRTMPLYALPHHLLSRLMFLATRARLRIWKDWQIAWFIRRYGVDMSVAAETEAARYPSFNSFFTRALRPAARPVAPGSDAVASPVDGEVYAAGAIEAGRLFQAKGRHFPLADLLASGKEWTDRFHGGSYAILYLAPRDYHRVHMPVAGRLRRSIYVPGRLFPVKPRTTRIVSGLFARNERIVALFETEGGPMALIMVGALFVGSMEVVWGARFGASGAGGLRTWLAPEDGLVLEKGSEIGRFNMGSTVMLLFGPRGVSLGPVLTGGQGVLMGQHIATIAA